MLDHIAKTDIGRARSNNEDYFLIDEALGLYILADGIGGHQYGEVAAQKACQIAQEKMSQILKLDPLRDLETAKALVKFAIYSANRAVIQMALDNPIYAGMGTTLLVVFRWMDHLLVGHVGDSRFYKAGQSLEALTDDHTHFVPKTPKSRSLRSKHYLTRSIGQKEFIEPSVSVYPLEKASTYLLCSDGLSDYLPHNIIETILNVPLPLEETADFLLDSALKTAARDNITFILLRASSPKTP